MRQTSHLRPMRLEFRNASAAQKSRPSPPTKFAEELAEVESTVSRAALLMRSRLKQAA